MMTATYSPDDNKLRLYASSRLDAELYKRVRGAGFIWAPKQELFVAPMWTPEREDLLIELCGEIDDEDKSLIDRAEAAADRFEDYSDARAKDADRAHAAVASIADNIPLGQPILIGHHSEKHARKDAEKIENGMRRAVKMWDQSKYWTQRAKDAISHAKYKERPDVRARRIKGLEADKRKQEKTKAEFEQALKLWNTPNLTHEQGIKIANYSHQAPFYLPRKEGDRPDWTQRCGAYEGLTNHYPNLYAARTVSEVVETAQTVIPKMIGRVERWLAHIENRLAYERAMMEETGGTASDKTGPEIGGGCRCWASPRGGWSWIKKVNKVSVTVWDNWGNSNDKDGSRNFTRNIPFDKLSAVMTKAQVEAKRAVGEIIESDDKTGFFVLADKPIQTQNPSAHGANIEAGLKHQAAAAETPPKVEEITEGRTIWNSDGTDGPCLITTPPEAPTPTPPPGNLAQKIKAIKEQLSLGIQVVSAPQLFPTPPDLAARMVKLAEIEPGQRILEPSAGTGNLLDKMYKTVCAEVVAVEIDPRLAERIAAVNGPVHCADFLTMNGDLGAFDRILMNPPFENGNDIKHIKHAVHMLKPGGRLVAICANGPRQQEQLKPLASIWEELPVDTFKDQGTGVRTVLLTIDKEDK